MKALEKLLNKFLDSENLNELTKGKWWRVQTTTVNHVDK